MAETGPVPTRGSAPITFDLSEERARQSRADARTYGWYSAVAIAIGLFALLGAVSVPPGSSSQVLLGLVAALFIVLPSLALYFTFIGGLTAITVSDSGLTFRRFRRPPVSIAWTDRRLGIVVTEFTAPPASFFPAGDSRAAQPQWLSISPPIRRETTVSADVAVTIARWAEAHGIRVERSPALVFGVASPRSPGVTPAARKISPGDTTTPNGRLVLIGPAARSN